MKKLSIVLLLLFAGVIAGWCESDSPERSKTAVLGAQMIEITRLDGTLTEIIDQLTAVQNKLNAHRNEIAEEIGKTTSDFKLNSYHKAVKHPRILYGLQLIRQLASYNEKIESKIRYFRNGQETLTYYLCQIEDDLRMLHTLKDGDVDELIAHVNTVMSELSPAARMPVINLEPVEPEPDEALWNDLLLEANNNPNAARPASTVSY